MNNPYHWSKVNLALIYGRDSLTNELVSRLPASQPISFALTGGRRMGKTSVLRYVENDFLSAADQWRSQGLLVVTVYVDGLAFARPLAPEQIWTFIFQKISKCFNPGAESPSAITGFTDFVERVSHQVEQCQDAVRIVVLFDELEPILAESWADAFFANWRALLSNLAPLSHSMAAVFAGARELVRLREDIGSPLMDILEFRSLRNLAFSEMKALASEPIETNMGEDFYEHLYGLTGGHPMLTQYIMQFACHQFDEFRVRAIQTADAAANQFSSGRSWQFSDWWNKYCTHGAQRVYARLPEACEFYGLKELVGEFGLRQANDALEVLQHVGIVNSDKEGREFKRAG